MSTFRALSHLTMYRSWATRTSKCSAVRYVEGETAFRAFHYVFQLEIRSLLFSINQQVSKVLKTFLKMLNQLNAEILTTSTTIKYRDSKHIKNWLRRTN
jgi:hypothetical protein